MSIRTGLIVSVIAIAASLTACGSDDIDSDEEARRAYFGLDASIEKSLTLGFAGFNAAQSANISPQMATGTAGGTLVITGQVDQGSSSNKGMRLRVGMVGYSDGPLEIDGETIDVDIVYDTAAEAEMQPYLDLQLKNIPTGTLTGTLTGTYTMKGDLEGEATVNLMFSGMLREDGTGKVGRVPGSTMVTGTVTSGDGTYEVSLSI
jgi:hypothetical protein